MTNIHETLIGKSKEEILKINCIIGFFPYSRAELGLRHIMRTAFQQSTVITIAHRISTVIDSDRIMVRNNLRNSQKNYYHFICGNKMNSYNCMTCSNDLKVVLDIYNLILYL